MQCACAESYWHLWPTNSTIHFSHNLAKGTICGKKINKCKICVLISCTVLSEIFLILRRNEGDIIKNIYWSSYKVPVLLSDFNEIWIFSIVFLKILKNQMSWKILQLGPCYSMWVGRRTDGRTDRRTDKPKDGRKDRYDETNSRSSQFCESA